MLPSLDAIFKPRSVAVIGASRNRQTISYNLLDSILSGGFNGPVYPVNPNSRVVHSIRAYSSVLDIPGGLDLAFVVVPKDIVPKVALECGERGVKGLVVISAGFKEVGGKGVEREAKLMETVRKHGMRMIGPNCMGVINMDSDIDLVGTFAPIMPIRGKVAFASQSGAMGYAILDLMKSLGLGVSKFASIGNNADVTGVDVLEYFGSDPATDIILLYLESFGDPFRFSSLAKEITKRKPVIAVKAGRTLAGARAASSHTGALASADVSVDALFEECGVMRSNTIEEMFDIAMAFTSQPLPGGDRIAIVTNAGGPAILATDAAIREGMRLAEFSEDTVRKLRSMAPEDSSLQNPLDLIAGATPDLYGRVMEVVLADPGVDSVLAIFAPTILLGDREFADAVVGAFSANDRKPVAACAIGRRGLTSGLSALREHSIPAYIFPESAIHALASMGKYREIRLRQEGTHVQFDARQEQAAAAISGRPAGSTTMLSGDEAKRVIEAYGFAMPKSARAGTREEAMAAAAGIGYPVALKAELSDFTHKTELGAVKIGLGNAEELGHAFDSMRAGLGNRGLLDRLGGFLVQEMVEGGVEVIVGAKRDGQFGHLVMFGLGGIAVEVLKDVSFKIAPVTDVMALDMIRSIKGYPLLTGFRGRNPANMEYIKEAIMRISRLVERFKEIEELDINPLVIFEDRNKCRALDVRIAVNPL